MKKLRNNIPNLITISRIISCFLGATFFITGNVYAALSCYAYGGISDAFDGYFARKLNAVTDFGKDLDALSDKIYALSLIAPAIIFGNFSMIIPLVLEAAIAGINSYSKI